MFWQKNFIFAIYTLQTAYFQAIQLVSLKSTYRTHKRLKCCKYPTFWNIRVGLFKGTIFVPGFRFVVSGTGTETFCIFIIFFFFLCAVPPLLKQNAERESVLYRGG